MAKKKPVRTVGVYLGVDKKHINDIRKCRCSWCNEHFPWLDEDIRDEPPKRPPTHCPLCGKPLSGVDRDDDKPTLMP